MFRFFSRYSPGGPYTTVVVLKRARADRTAAEIASAALQFHQEVRHHLPEFHTRQMRKRWRQQ